MVGGADRGEVVRVLAVEGVPARTADDYIKRVRDRWLAESQAERPTTRARQLRRLYRHLRRLATENRYRDVLACEKLIAELEGNTWSQCDRDALGATSRKRHNLTWEQIEWMAANGGKVPPGVTLEDLGDL